MILQHWFTAFLQNRQQRVKVANTTSEWHSINGGVPQGTLCGPQMFVHMVSDLHTDIPDTKFMDDTTLVEIEQKCKGSKMQQSADDVAKWSTVNQLGLNTVKTKEMVISFGTAPVIDPLSINGCIIEQVSESKLLGVIIQNNLKWDSHIKYINVKASKRLHYLRCLKRSGLNKNELKTIYVALIRSVCEYACPVWSTCLTKELSDKLESVQRRAFRIILPSLSYEEACIDLNLSLLSERRNTLCKQFFDSMKQPSHKLHDLLPSQKPGVYNLRNNHTYPLPKCNTNRYKNSFVPHCLFNFQ